MKKSILTVFLVFTAILLAACSPTLSGIGTESESLIPEKKSTSPAVETASEETSPPVTEAPNQTSNTPQSEEISETSAAPTTANTPTEPALITRESAVNAALTHAGLKESDVWDLDAELDRERGSIIWEVDFETPEYEYSYDVDAVSGEIIRSEKERD